MRRILASLALCAATCAWSKAPPGFLPTAEQAQRSTRGGWIVVTEKTGAIVEGELIAVHPKQLYVLDGRHLVAVHISQVESIHFEGYRTQAGSLSLWTTLSSLAAATNGVFLIITVPLTVLVGTISAAVESRAAFVDYPGDELTIWKFARFPQGLPPGVDDCALLTGSPCVPIPDAAPAIDAAPPPDAGPEPDAAVPDAAPVPRDFELSSTGPYHASGHGLWFVVLKGHELHVERNVNVLDIADYGNVTLSDAEVASLWQKLDAAHAADWPAKVPGVPDEQTISIKIGRHTGRVAATDRDPAVRALLDEITRLVEQYTREKVKL